MDNRAELFQLIVDFMADLEEVDESFNGVLYTGESIMISNKQKILDIAEEIGLEVDEELKEEDTLFIALEDEDEEGENDGYLQ